MIHLIKKRLVFCYLIFASAHVFSASPPNFLIIVADDLGFSDLGAFGGEIDTPNLDALADKGLRLTQFHANPSCSPSRATLLTGIDNHIAGLGTMAELRPDELKDVPGYEGWLNRRVVTIAELLRPAGYRTIMSGKWHLGLAEDQSPAARGFTKSFALLQGGHNHFGLDQEEKNFMHSSYREDFQLTHYPEGAYSSDVFAERLINYLKATETEKKPFFAYLAFTAPHWPLQAPVDSIDKYRGYYDDGPEALRAKRLMRMQSLGIISPESEPHVMEGVKPWNSLSAQERALESRKMEVYAAMVDRMDANIGKVLQYLKSSGELENTVIFFLSDNGAEGSQLDGGSDADAAKGFGGVLKRWIAENFNNDLAHLGHADSFTWYGPGWAEAATAPSRLYKGFPTEGGTRVPAIVSGRLVERHGISAAVTSIADIAPTILDLAGVAYSSQYNSKAVPPLRGHSWASLMQAHSDQVYASTEALGWELFYRRAIRVGDWKAVYLPQSVFNSAIQPGRWELFNLRDDPGESHDISKMYPEKMRELKLQWDHYADQVGVQIPSVLQ